MMPRPQFTLRALLVAMLVVGAFFGGIRFERERRKREDEAAAAMAAAKAPIKNRPQGLIGIKVKSGTSRRQLGTQE
jgi:hypothetical protein